jgi:hypothetical protein
MRNKILSPPSARIVGLKPSSPLPPAMTDDRRPLPAGSTLLVDLDGVVADNLPRLCTGGRGDCLGVVRKSSISVMTRDEVSRTT